MEDEVNDDAEYDEGALAVYRARLDELNGEEVMIPHSVPEVRILLDRLEACRIEHVLLKHALQIVGAYPGDE